MRNVGNEILHLQAPEGTDLEVVYTQDKLEPMAKFTRVGYVRFSDAKEGVYAGDLQLFENLYLNYRAIVTYDLLKIPESDLLFFLNKSTEREIRIRNDLEYPIKLTRISTQGPSYEILKPYPQELLPGLISFACSIVAKEGARVGGEVLELQTNIGMIAKAVTTRSDSIE